MPRPSKRRRVCGRPACARFGPRGQERTPEEPFVSMTLDEYECIRLMDLEGLTQEQCAAQMEVARTTVQAVIRARGKNWLCVLPKGWNCGSAGAIMSYASRGQGAADGTARVCLRTLKVKEKKK